jgi:hypothetical protein
MPYFFILPVFVLYVLALSAAVAVASLYRPAAFLRPYAVAVLIWSSLGFLASSVLYTIALVASAQAMNSVLHGAPSVVGGVAMGGMVFVVPFIASTAGVLGGAAVGLWRASSKQRRATRRNAAPDERRMPR